VLSAPPDFTDSDLKVVISRHWPLAPETVAYRAVGFGSHHWEVDSRWFATVDESPDFERLRSALRSATDVPVAIAPIPTRDGDLVVRAGRFAVALYPFVVGSRSTSATIATMLTASPRSRWWLRCIERRRATRSPTIWCCLICHSSVT
jgi:hypothetical protein